MVSASVANCCCLRWFWGARNSYIKRWGNVHPQISNIRSDPAAVCYYCCDITTIVHTDLCKWILAIKSKSLLLHKEIMGGFHLEDPLESPLFSSYFSLITCMEKTREGGREGRRERDNYFIFYCHSQAGKQQSAIIKYMASAQAVFDIMETAIQRRTLPLWSCMKMDTGFYNGH